jgi:hypothetical protein
MTEIRNIVCRLVLNSDSLIEEVDNNSCEQSNSIINKHIGDKRINFTQGNNYQTRVQAVIVAYYSRNYTRIIHKKIMLKSPGKLFKNIYLYIICK